MEKRLFLAVKLDKRFTNWNVRLTPKEAMEFCKSAEEYNNLTKKGACELIGEIDKIIPLMRLGKDNPNTGQSHHYYRIGREGSRVIYLEIVKTYLFVGFDYVVLGKKLFELGKKANADEHYVEKNTHLEFVYRFWWD